MLPAAQHQAAIDVLDIWLSGQSLDMALSRWARGARYAGAKDRRAVRDIVYSVLRSRGRARSLGTSPVSRETGRALVFGWLRLNGADFGRVFTGQGHAPEPLGAEERRLLSERTQAPIGLDTPDWLLQHLTVDFGQETDAILQAMADRAPLYLRVHAAPERLEDAQQDAIAQLSEDGIAAMAEPACQTALRVTENGQRLAQSQAYLRGLVEPQDLSVQMACQRIDWPRKARILDYCAGGGGKALAIAAATQGPVYVHDAASHRMADLPKRAVRAGADLRIWDQATSDAAFDLVLCDVPCSGSGTWRRDPERRWRMDQADLRRLQGMQADILAAAAELLRPGRQLVYMTCSLLGVENVEQVSDFLQKNEGSVLRQTVQFTPLNASDGFFMAEVLRP